MDQFSKVTSLIQAISINPMSELKVGGEREHGSVFKARHIDTDTVLTFQSALHGTVEK